MNKNDKKTKVPMNDAELKAVSGGELLTGQWQIPQGPTTVFTPIFPGGFRHW